ncbi:putative Double Clp-N motif-containing P-loop nucleoside triphosphate hydrolases superfamily protein [Hibiscus syriacus]|uniref:Double Clp-N motif-containing P-loop nucleoside triphosphate hydrolases superfamily protein n=1 Tax=Hibiscus syriacus TaxID=106335 RepID=A0A6A2YM80_HIBSY|nr:putative Double Clp-N motif-containing P-loop nucleoside triphosphate hydrolases superfamily protein [Hibiscus syriacus]
MRNGRTLAEDPGTEPSRDFSSNVHDPVIIGVDHRWGGYKYPTTVTDTRGELGNEQNTNHQTTITGHQQYPTGSTKPTRTSLNKIIETHVEHQTQPDQQTTHFQTAIEEGCHDMDEPSLWYGKRIGSRKMGFEERTRGSDGVTALHCAVAGGSFCSTEVVRILLDAGEDTNSLDANGNRLIDSIAPDRNSALSLKKMLKSLLKGSGRDGEIESLPVEIEGCNSRARVLKDGTEKKEYAIDFTLPDIKSRHMARMSSGCVISRSRLARGLTLMTGPSALLFISEKMRGDVILGNTYTIAFLALNSVRVLASRAITASMHMVFSGVGFILPNIELVYVRTRLIVAESYRFLFRHGSMSLHGLDSLICFVTFNINTTLDPYCVPSLQLHDSRLKNARRVRNMELDMEQLGLESCRRRQTQPLIDEMPGISSTTNWNNPLSTTSTSGESNRFGGISLDTSTHQAQSPTGANYMTNLTSSPMRASQSFGVDPSRPTAGTILSPNAFANRWPSFMELTSVNHHSGFSSLSAVPCNFSDWGSPNGK